MTLKDKKILELREQLAALQKEANQLKIDVADTQRVLAGKFDLIDEIQEELTAMEDVHVKAIVTDHALIRYLERMKGLNRAQVEAEILSPEILSWVNKLGGSGTYPSKEGFSICIKDGVVKTIKINK